MSPEERDALEIALLMLGAIAFWGYILFLALTAPPA